MTDEHIMNMPIKRFWLFSESIDRINASSDMRQLSIHSSLSDKGAMEGKIEDLNKLIGTVVIRDFKRDAEGINKLKMLLR